MTRAMKITSVSRVISDGEIIVHRAREVHFVCKGSRMALSIAGSVAQI
jgi:hypothetical protein